MKFTIPKTFKAAVLYSKNKLIIRDDIIIPPLKRGQLLIKMYFSGLCHSQLMEIYGHRGRDKYIPHLLGHEGTGKVIQAGKDVKNVNKGDDVILSWLKGKGIDAGGIKLKTVSGDIINAGPITTFSNYTIVSENRATILPKNISKKKGVLYGCAIPTGAGIVLNETLINKNSTVGVFGLGGIGLLSLLTAAQLKPKMLIGFDVEKKKLDVANKFGATHTICVKNSNITKEVKKITQNKGLDIIIEAAGLTKTIESAFDLIKTEGGQVIFASHPRANQKISLDPYDLIQGKQIKGTWGGGFVMDRDINRFDKLMKNKKILLNYFVNKVYNLDNINDAVSDLKNRKVLRAILK